MHNTRPPMQEEFANALTHGLGAALSAIGGAALITLAFLGGDGWQRAGALVFSISLLLLYTASSLYHAARAGKIKDRLEIFDHSAIYLLIAGTYTPFTLVSIRGALGWTLFGIIWGLALAGVIFKLFFLNRAHLLSTALYIAMGWLVIIAAGPMIRALPWQTLAWLAAGGVIYTAGTYFYHNTRIRYSHTIWHLFVIGGSVCHYIAVASQVT